MEPSHNLVFLHGWGTGPGVWKHQVGYFSNKYQVETPYIVGGDLCRGAQPCAPTLTTNDQRLPADLSSEARRAKEEAQMAQAGPTTVLIGWSYGGMLAIESAVKEPDRFKAIVLVGCSAKFTDGMNPIIIKNIRRGLNRYFEETMRNCYGTFFLTGEAAFMKEFIEEQILPDPKETIRMLERLLVMDLRSSLKDITTPTLIIHGDQDEICPLAAGEFLHKGIQGSRLAVIGGAGHMPFYTQPAEFNNIVENFLNGLK